MRYNNIDAKTSLLRNVTSPTGALLSWRWLEMWPVKLQDAIGSIVYVTTARLDKDSRDQRRRLLFPKRLNIACRIRRRDQSDKLEVHWRTRC